MHAVQIIRLAQTTPQRWRNNGGNTREIACAPDAQHWDWRLSLADVESDGAFSVFPGIQRHIVLLSGAGMRLCFDDGEQVELTPEQPDFAFSGQRPLSAQLLAGATSDFNLMWNPQRVHARLWLRPLVGTALVCANAGQRWAVHVVSGSVRLESEDEALMAGDTALLGDGVNACKQRLQGSGLAIFICLEPPGN